MSSPDRAAEAFTRLVRIMAALRAPEGCPWDRAQTIDSLKPFVLEETYEVLDAIDRHDHAALCEELGDFLFEAVFLAQMEAEAGQFTIADSLGAIADKLVRRHPHVFQPTDGERNVRTPDDVRVRWEEIKAEEKAARGDNAGLQTLLSGIAPTLPALLRAYHIGMRAASVNFDWTRVAQVVDKIQEEVDELRDAVAQGGASGNRERAEDEMGDLLFSIAQLARQLEIEPETALRKANDKFTRRFTKMERAIAAAQRPMREMTLEELETAWQAAKNEAG